MGFNEEERHRRQTIPLAYMTLCRWACAGDDTCGGWERHTTTHLCLQLSMQNYLKKALFIRMAPCVEIPVLFFLKMKGSIIITSSWVARSHISFSGSVNTTSGMFSRGRRCKQTNNANKELRRLGEVMVKWYRRLQGQWLFHWLLYKVIASTLYLQTW